MTKKGGAAAGGDAAESSSCSGGTGGSKVIFKSDGSFLFEVNSIPGEVSVISWKKLLRVHASEIAARASFTSRPNEMAGGQFPTLSAPPASAGYATPYVPVGANAKVVAAPSNRLNDVIGKIDQLYVKASSDEENLSDVPDDDEYDTEDSFIDDSDLNDYLLADNSAAATHDGYYVQGRKFAGIEPSMLPIEQSEKRRMKALSEDSDAYDYDPNPSNHARPGKKPRKPAQLSKTREQSNLTEATRDEKNADSEPSERRIRLVNANSDPNDRRIILRIPCIPKNEGASASLEKAIKDLEKLVTESRPPRAAVSAESSSQVIRKRLPQNIKLKLAEVATFAQASDGKIRKQMLDRLMSIVGHLVTLKTLKRNLKKIVSEGLSTKQDNMVQLAKD